MNNNNEEQWKPVVGYEGLYAVSSLGNVKSVERTCKTWYGMRRVKEKILKPTLGGKEGYEYLTVKLYKNGKKKTYNVHRLVAEAFPEICGLPFEGADVNHIDENPLNNRADNLNWLSHPDNCNHGTRNERIAKAMTNGKCSKTVYQYDKDTHELVKKWVSVSEVYRQMGWSQGNISQCCNNHFNREGNNVYKGFIWSYEQHKRNR